MPVLKRGRCVQWAEVAARKIKLKDLGGVQSVNVCSPANRAGEYELFVFLRGPFKMTPDDVARFATLDALKSELRRRAYRSVVR